MSTLPLIPRPLHLETGQGCFQLSLDSPLRSESALAHHAIQWFQDTLYQLTGVMLPSTSTATPGEIFLQVQSDQVPESYTLQIATQGIEIHAGDAAGFFYALVTLLQLMQLDRPMVSGQWYLPEVSIEDSPRFGWRGLMLDSVSHFQPVSWIKKFIDVMALHKLNTLHWHLTDDQGRRVEIKKYAALTSVSAWRRESRVGHEEKDENKSFNGRPHGGFYSQEQLRDVVTYAAARGTTIIPEIEMPGHAKAVLSAYPELSCAGGPFEVAPHWGIFEDVFCAGNDAAINFLEDVLEEVLDIFPSSFIHVGGDECPKLRWTECPKCQERIKKENLANEHELQSWFVRHFDRFLTARGRRLIGWDEILEGGLAQNAAVMSWRGESGGIAAAQAGHDVVMAPHEAVYFDYYQSENVQDEPLAIGSYTSLAKVYAYEPVPYSLSAEEAQHILGAQGQLWTEYMPLPANVEYMAFPRACALAERLWSAAEPHDFQEFCGRLKGHLPMLDRLGICYRALDASTPTSIK